MDGMPGDIMNGTMGTGSTGGMMGPFSVQLGVGLLWFPGWAPTTAPATFACCVGLFFLAAFSRFLDALRIACAPQTTYDRRNHFLLRAECTCAALFVLWSGIMYFLMLAVMQYNAYFFIAILLGHGAGELGFGRHCYTSRRVADTGSRSDTTRIDENEKVDITP